MTNESGSKKIAILLPCLYGGGAERVTLALAGELARRGHQVDLVLVHHGGDLMPLVPPGVRIIEIRAARIRASILPLVAYLRRERPDALQAVMWPQTLVAVFARALARTQTRVMLVDHSTLSKQFPGKFSAVRWTIRWLYPRANTRVIVSESSADDIAQFSGLPRSMWSVIHNPVDLPEVLLSNSDVERLWSGANERLISVGRLTAEKNYALLIKAFAVVMRKRPNARLLVIGQGALEAELKALTERLGLQHQVVFPGFVLDPWPYFASADLFVLSSSFEGFPVALIEALHAGLRIVSTDCPGGPREILDAGRFGRLVPVDAVGALARAIDESLDQDVDSEHQRARAWQLSGQQQVDRYEELL